MHTVGQEKVASQLLQPAAERISYVTERGLDHVAEADIHCRVSGRLTGAISQDVTVFEWVHNTTLILSRGKPSLRELVLPHSELHLLESTDHSVVLITSLFASSLGSRAL